jgi:multisubunit Na+/H+ antiporter MnhF subunit
MPDNPDRATERELNVHIFSVSAQLVGICLTVLGLFRVMTRLQGVSRIADQLLALDAIAFLTACVFAYASLRSQAQSRRRALERVADVGFGVALLLMTAVCILIAWELI